ncbi:MAG: threonine synthase [Halobacteriota archaeon]
MQTSEAFVGLRCTETGETYDVTKTGRSSAGAPLDPAYDYDGISLDPETLDRRERSMWRFAELLPFAPSAAVSTAEGGTPLVEAPSLAADLGVGRVVLKDEGRNPTGTVLDRGMSLAVTAAAEAGVEHVGLASPGNSGPSAAAYAGRAGLIPHAFLPSRSAFGAKAMVNVHGGDMTVVGGRYADALDAFTEQAATEWYSLQEFDSPYRHEGAKTVAFELVADLDWTVPDAVVLAAGTGELVTGLVKGFRELLEVGLTDAVPRVYAAQPSGCAPIAAAFESGTDRVEPWDHPDTICGELEIPDPAGGALALDALEETGGGVVVVDDEDILESAVVATHKEGIEMSADSGAAAAGAWTLATDTLGPDDTVALLNAEAGAKTADILRSHLMGQGI